MKNILLIGSSGKMGEMIKKNIPSPFYIEDSINLSSSLVKDKRYYAVLDFSSPQGTMTYAPIFISRQIPYIAGTTGLTLKMIETLKKLCDEHHSYFNLVPNFNLSFNAFINSLIEVKKNFDSALIEEWHNITKKDLPSGSALAIKDALSPLKVRFVAHRINKTKFIHKVTLFSSTDLYVAKHIVLDRVGYMKGIVYALNNISPSGFKNGL